MRGFRALKRPLSAGGRLIRWHGRRSGRLRQAIMPVARKAAGHAMRLGEEPEAKHAAQNALALADSGGDQRSLTHFFIKK